MNFSNYTFDVQLLSLQSCSGFQWQKHHVYSPEKGCERGQSGQVSAGQMNDTTKWEGGLQPLKSLKQFPV